mmetsp:Transcript_1607/g.2835  ORF Transcript_1607/g.2835 Transcript_1607/m.2835 type:complete len:140 (-) Transcript_1607:244-663(-)
MLGNEGSGLNQNQIAICDHFVYVPQYTDKTASLNVAIAASIIFHHYGLWAGHKEHSRDGFKYETVGENAMNYKQLENKPIVTFVTYDEESMSEVATNQEDLIREERNRKKEQAAQQDGLLQPDSAQMSSVFDEKGDSDY